MIKREESRRSGQWLQACKLLTSVEVDVSGHLERVRRGGGTGRSVRGGVGAVVGARALRRNVFDGNHALRVQVVVAEARARLEEAQAEVVRIDHPAPLLEPDMRVLDATEQICIEIENRACFIL